jgi:hypothetical protein
MIETLQARQKCESFSSKRPTFIYLMMMMMMMMMRIYGYFMMIDDPD